MRLLIFTSLLCSATAWVLHQSYARFFSTPRAPHARDVASLLDDEPLVGLDRNLDRAGCLFLQLFKSAQRTVGSSPAL